MGLCDEYFEWICQLVCDNKKFGRFSYRKLLCRLYDRDFVCLMPMDENRTTDGLDLRYRFGYENGYDRPTIDTHLNHDHPCSVLEMMISLAHRCEESIMDDPDKGNRTGEWFWGMMSSLKLLPMFDEYFDKELVDHVITIFLNRQYKRNGEGGLFTINNCPHDLRAVEIWYQMCWYLDTILK